MSAVHGPMPWTAVSAAWASSAGFLVSAERSSSPRSMAFAMAFSVRIFGAESPARASLAARAQHRSVVERVEGLGEPCPELLGARGRELLRNAERDQTPESSPPAPQRRPPRPREDHAEARIGVDEAGDGVIEIGLGVDEE